MTAPNTFIYQMITLLLLCGTNTYFLGQTRSIAKECTAANLSIYEDSLASLGLAYQPMQMIHLADSLIQQHDDLNCPEIVYIKSARANAYELLYNFEKALEIYNELLKTVEKNNFIEEEITVRLSLARVYETISRPELCIENLEKAKKLIDTHGIIKQLSRYYVRYSSYQRVHKRDKALAKKFAALAITLGKEHSVIRSVADGNLVMGLVTDNFEESIQYTARSSNLFFELGDKIGSMSQQRNIARRYLQRGSYDKVLEIINEVERYTEQIKDNDKVYYRFKMEIAKIKADVYERIDDKEKLIPALKDYNEYLELFGFLVNQEEINKLILDNSIEQEKEKIEAAKKQNRLLLFGFLGLLGITMLLARLYWLNSKRKNQIQEQKATITNQYSELEQLYNYQSTLLSEVHHRIKNNLQLIISLVTIQKSRLATNANVGILDMLSHRVNSISLIHEQLYNSKEFDKVDVGLYIDNLIKNFVALLSEKNVSIEYNVNDIQLNLETITPLGLIWSELISNSLKYNQDKNGLHIHVELVKKEEQYFMHYFDNGKGYPDGQFSANKVGMGFTIINSLSRQLSAKPNSYNSNGAHFKIAFKEKVISPL